MIDVKWRASMWDDEKQNKLDQLRLREAQGTMTDAEGEALRVLLADLDAEEAATLGPAIERMRASQRDLSVEREQVDRENERLASILAKQERLLSDAQAYLNHLRAERSVLSEEYRAVTGRQSSPSP
jgi:hypothetical protein